MINYNFTKGIPDVSVKVIQPAMRESEKTEFEKRGVAIRRSLESRLEKSRKERNVKADKAIKLRKQGMTVVEIAKELNVVQNTVYRYLRGY